MDQQRHPWLHRYVNDGDNTIEPVFSPSDDATLASFAALFLSSGLQSFDANKHLRTDAWSPIYDCETESVAAPGQAPQLFAVVWTPVWTGTDPVAGFRTGQDSAYLGSTATIAMPQDERTAALLMLVTTSYVHLSGRWENSRPVVQAALDVGEPTFRFVELVPESLPLTTHQPREGERQGR
jgi:hypothetical protein